MAPPSVLTLFTLAILLGTTQAFIVLRFGNCPNVPTKTDFDKNRYLGTWYSYTNFDVPFQYGADCVTANYELNDDGSIKVVNTGVRRFNFFGTYYNIENDRAEGKAVIVDPAVPGGLKVQFGGAPDTSNKANYLIADTDYDTYSVVYSCSPLFDPNVPINIESSWILTRQRGVAPSNINDLKSNLAQYGVNTGNFKKVCHDKCE